MKSNPEIIKDQIIDIGELFLQYKKLKTEAIASQSTGFLLLFTGPSGTGKTLAANMLEKITGLTILRLDLSRVVSKYIGETEKNLSRLFDKAQSSGMILFFDEADALFGKRTNVKDSHDKYANQEISYLIKLLNNFPGIAIISTTTEPILDIHTKRKFRTILDFNEKTFNTYKEGKE
jgi:SpoVK/Ycf46/Vps4 family AAA+-type ATPase